MTALKVLISADMEGISGIVDADDVNPEGQDYTRGREMMALDVCAAIDGVRDAQPNAEITVNDAHGPMRNLLPEHLPSGVRLIRGKPKRLGMGQGLEDTPDALLCIGYHARAGAPGVLSHSFMGHEIEDITLDGQPAGELSIVCAAALAHGTPTVLVTGDDVAAAEAAALDSQIVAVTVKRAVGRFAADLVDPASARTLIRAGAATAMKRAGRGAPNRTPREMTVRWQSTAVAAQLVEIPTVAMVDDRTVAVSGDGDRLLALLGVFLRVATALTNQQPYC